MIPEKELSGESLFNAIDGILRDRKPAAIDGRKNSLRMGKGGGGGNDRLMNARN